MTEREALKLALEALQEVYLGSRSKKHDEAITVIEEVLAQPKQEPVERGGLRFYTNGIERQHWKADGSIDFKDEKGNVTMTLASGEIKAPIHFCALRQRTWVGLTDEDWKQLFLNTDAETLPRAIEAKLKEKNT